MSPQSYLFKLCCLVICGHLGSRNSATAENLTKENALNGETLEHHILHQLPEPNREALAEMVAGALVQDLEESIKGCDIDPEDREESIQRCLKNRELLLSAATATTTESADSWLAESADTSTSESVTTSNKESVTSSDVEVNSVADQNLEKIEKHYLLLKTAFLNLNEEMKDKPDLTNAKDIQNLLDKIDELVAEKVNEKQVDSTVVHIPTEAELEEAVTSQNYEASGAEFWNTLFSVSDKLAMGLLLKIKSVARDKAVTNLQTFLDGNDEERLRILAETLKLTRIQPKEVDSANAVKRSGFIAYNQQGIAVDEEPDQSGNPASVKRSGFVGSDDHKFTDEELEEQIKRYGFVSSHDNSLESKDRKGLNVRSDVPAVIDPQQLQYTGYEDPSSSNFEEAYKSSDFEESKNSYDGTNSGRTHQSFSPSHFQERHEAAQARNDHGVNEELRLEEHHKRNSFEAAKEHGDDLEAKILDIIEHMDDPLKHQAGVLSHSGHLKTVEQVENPIKRVGPQHHGQQQDYSVVNNQQGRFAGHHAPAGIHSLSGIQAGSGRPIKRSGLDTHPHLTHLDEEIFGNAPTLDHFPAVPLEEPVIEEHAHHQESGVHHSHAEHQAHVEHHTIVKAMPSPLSEAQVIAEGHLTIIVVTSLIVLSLVGSIFLNRMRLRRYFNKNIAYRRID